MVIGNFESLCQPEEINEFVIFPSNPAERLATLSSGCYLWYYPQDGSQFSRVILAIYICLLAHLAKFGPIRGKHFRTGPYYCKTNLFSQWHFPVFVIVISLQELNA